MGRRQRQRAGVATPTSEFLRVPRTISFRLIGSGCRCASLNLGPPGSLFCLSHLVRRPVSFAERPQPVTVVAFAIVDGELHPSGDVLKRDHVGVRLPRQDGFSCPADGAVGRLGLVLDEAAHVAEDARVERLGQLARQVIDEGVEARTSVVSVWVPRIAAWNPPVWVQRLLLQHPFAQ
eukprot:scaffold11192_cov77-Phaeocystis_antarctica.AAC.5